MHVLRELISLLIRRGNKKDLLLDFGKILRVGIDGKMKSFLFGVREGIPKMED